MSTRTTCGNRFRGAQDVFFAARSSVFAERDAEQSENLKLKEELAEEAEKLVPVQDLKPPAPPSVHQQRWEAIGHVPRDARPKVEGRMTWWSGLCRSPRRPSGAGPTLEARARAEGLTGQLQAAVDKLQGQIETARAAGNTSRADKLQKELDGRRGAARPGVEGSPGVRRAEAAEAAGFSRHYVEGLPHGAYGSPST